MLLHDEPERMRKKMRKAFLDPNDPHSPVYELIEHIIFPEFGKLVITPKPEFGEPTTWTDLASLKAAIGDSTVHPLDAKFGVADALSEGLSDLSEYFANNPEKLETVNNFTGQ